MCQDTHDDFFFSSSEISPKGLKKIIIIIIIIEESNKLHYQHNATISRFIFLKTYFALFPITSMLFVAVKLCVPRYTKHSWGYMIARSNDATGATARVVKKKNFFYIYSAHLIQLPCRRRVYNKFDFHYTTECTDTNIILYSICVTVNLFFFLLRSGQSVCCLAVWLSGMLIIIQCKVLHYGD
ncbi:hypothetical protein L873DRAFT_1205598 [Choiromyces venosus 120613-1]|uniref:Uncharacterized protein n=1 Tax=Choiromyces venosus 120613-1 TaxID=1336337 RepID=A0A3N4JEG2_9PEZI|nr:hypothetical protein L873DRAFT_1205598 [Choiromyces venosus 120613-1]